ncbi:MAG TPA: hypothetical protein VHY56_10510 [Candidatus Binataceae bacterium]|nr:hypothetical protein [Candidatus Binataceae bacterium]
MDNTRLRAMLNWEPQVSLEEGLRRTYAWIEEQVRLTYFAPDTRGVVVAEDLVSGASAQ